MDVKKKISIEDIDRKFEELKQRTSIKDRYGVFTQKMFEQVLEELRLRIREDVKSELHSLDGKLDWLITQYRKLDEEHTLLFEKVSSQTDRLEVLEEKLHIQL